MADDFALSRMRPDSIFASSGTDFHSCRYSSWDGRKQQQHHQQHQQQEQDRQEQRRWQQQYGARRGLHNSSSEESASGSSRNTSAWQGMEGELERLDAANIKITEVDLLCLGDSDNVMYEFKFESPSSNDTSAAPSPACAAAEPPPTFDGPMASSKAHLDGLITSSRAPFDGSSSARYSDRPQTALAARHPHLLQRSGGSGPLAGPMGLGHVAAPQRLLSPHQSALGSPADSPLVHLPAGAGQGQPKSRVQQLLSVADADVEGYFSAMESLDASPRGEEDGDPDGQWADEEQDMLRADQLTRLLMQQSMVPHYDASHIAGVGGGLTEGQSSESSPTSSFFSSPAAHMSPASTDSSYTVGPDLGRHLGSGSFLSPSRQLSPRTRTSSQPVEREGSSHKPFLGRSPSEAGNRSSTPNSPLRGGAQPSTTSTGSPARSGLGRRCGASRLSGLNPEASSSHGSLTALVAEPGCVEPPREAVIAETAVDLESLTSLDLEVLPEAGHVKSHMSRFRKPSMGGSGPLTPRTDMVFGSLAGGEDEGGSEERRRIEPMTPSRYPERRASRHFRTSSWTGADNLGDLTRGAQSTTDDRLPQQPMVSQEPVIPGRATGQAANQMVSATGQVGVAKDSQGSSVGKPSSQKVPEKSKILEKLSKRLWGKKPSAAAKSASFAIEKPVPESSSSSASSSSSVRMWGDSQLGSIEARVRSSSPANKGPVSADTLAAQLAKVGARPLAVEEAATGELAAGSTVNSASTVPALRSEAPSKYTMSRRKRQEMGACY